MLLSCYCVFPLGLCRNPSNHLPVGQFFSIGLSGLVRKGSWSSSLVHPITGYVTLLLLSRNWDNMIQSTVYIIWAESVSIYFCHVWPVKVCPWTGFSVVTGKGLPCSNQWGWSTIHSSPVSFSVCPKCLVGDVSQVPYLVISICATHSSLQTHKFSTCPTSIHQSPVVVEGITSAIQLDEEFVLYSTPGDVCCWDRMSVKVRNGTVTVVIHSEQECHEDQQQRFVAISGIVCPMNQECHYLSLSCPPLLTLCYHVPK